MAQLLDPKEVMQLIISLKEDEQMQIVLLLWHWWLERNRVREGERMRSAEDLAYIIQKQSAELLKPEASNAGQSIPTRKRWSRSREGFPKINIDGSLSTNSGHSWMMSD
jgi:hypothetical protein